MTFAGTSPKGLCPLHEGELRALIDGAGEAARRSLEGLGGKRPELAVLISCVGRKLVLRQRTEEEVEAVRDALGGGPALAGFNSYGEIAPFSSGGPCALHTRR